jgi:hypothetical protein
MQTLLFLHKIPNSLVDFLSSNCISDNTNNHNNQIVSSINNGSVSLFKLASSQCARYKGQSGKIVSSVKMITIEEHQFCERPKLHMKCNTSIPFLKSWENWTHSFQCWLLTHGWLASHTRSLYTYAFCWLIMVYFYLHSLTLIPRR